MALESALFLARASPKHPKRALQNIAYCFEMSRRRANSRGVGACILFGKGQSTTPLDGIVLGTTVVHVEIALDPLQHF